MCGTSSLWLRFHDYLEDDRVVGRLEAAAMPSATNDATARRRCVAESRSDQDPNARRCRFPSFALRSREAEIEEVAACLRSGWLTTGPRTKQFEAGFAAAVGAKHALAVNSCTAALHLAVEALGLRPGQAVLVPTMTFAATAEVVRYQGAVPLLVDCEPVTLNMDLADAARKIADLRAGRTPLDPALQVVGIIPVHVGGLMLDMDAVRAFAAEHGLWVVEDAAHAFPAAYRGGPERPWRRCGENTAAVTCFSFYANKTMTTGEGGMAVTDDDQLAARMRQMSLHGLSHDAWKRYSGNSAWDYRIVAAGFKYNLTDIAAAIGNCQLRRAEEMRARARGDRPRVPPGVGRPGADRVASRAGRPHPFLAPVSHPLESG